MINNYYGKRLIMKYICGRNLNRLKLEMNYDLLLYIFPRMTADEHSK